MIIQRIKEGKKKGSRDHVRKEKEAEYTDESIKERKKKSATSDSKASRRSDQKDSDDFPSPHERHQLRIKNKLSYFFYLNFIFYFLSQLNKSVTFELMSEAINSSESKGCRRG